MLASGVCVMADAMFMYAVTTGFFIGLVAILFGTRARKSNESVSDSVTSRSEGAVSSS
ncbi:MAG TPA: hypothetical protein VGK47_00025 [Nitrososphaeraceae archaeon]